MYLVFALIAGVIGGILSIVHAHRTEYPGLQIFDDPHLLQRVRHRRTA